MSSASLTAPTSRTAILFFTHLFDNTVRTAFEQLQREASGVGDLFVLTEVTGAVPSWTGRVHRFDFSQLRQQYPNIMGSALIPGNAHLADLSFYKAHPEYDYCWTIEYDVRFSGSWAVFFEEFQNNTADLLATHVRRYEDEPAWYWWGTLRTPDGLVALEKRVRAFLPVRRMSRRILDLLMSRDLQGLGWHGHYECLIPSVLIHYGLSLEDIGGDGFFTPQARRCRFYSSFGFHGALRHFGSMRFRPALAFWGGRSNFLYHPVKSGVGGWFASAFNLVGCVGYCIRYLCTRHGFTLLRDLAKYAGAVLSVPKKPSED